MQDISILLLEAKHCVEYAQRFSLRSRLVYDMIMLGWNPILRLVNLTQKHIHSLFFEPPPTCLCRCLHYLHYVFASNKKVGPTRIRLILVSQKERVNLIKFEKREFKKKRLQGSIVSLVILSLAPSLTTTLASPVCIIFSSGYPFYGRSVSGTNQMNETHNGMDEKHWHTDDGSPQVG